MQNALVTIGGTDPNMKILVAEDDAGLRGGLEKSLREKGYAVDGAHDGEEAAYRARENAYDVIVLDVGLPKKDGLTVLREIRTRCAAPVLILTSKGMLEDRVRGLDAGADDYLTKPFDLEELHARLRALIRRSQGHAEPVLRFDRVTIDTAKRFVILDGLPVDLTPREYSLVEYLAFRRGHVVTRTELYEHLFAEEDESCSNLLDVHVCNVRHKLGREFIRTHRGHGYSIAED